METYEEMKNRQQKEFNGLPLGFAFSQKQFDEMMRKFGLESNDVEKITNIGAGGYIKKEDLPLLENTLKRHRAELEHALKSDKKSNSFAYEALYYELCNHEYSYTGDSEPALMSLGLTLEDVNTNENLKEAFLKATKDVMQDCE